METKKKRSLLDTIPAIWVLAFVLLLIGDLTGGIIISHPIFSSSDAWTTSQIYMNFIGIWIVSLIYFFVNKNRRYILDAISPKEKGNNIKWLGIGMLMGFGLNAICILAAWLNKDIILHFDSIQIAPVLGIFVAVFIQSSAEELLCRGYMYQRILKSYNNHMVAIIGNALFFAFLHIFNEGVTVIAIINITLSGLMFSLLVYFYDSIWAAMALHAAWNYTQNIIFGLPNSGMVLPFSIIKLDSSTARNSLFYDVGFGIEGTAFSCLILLVACIVMCCINKEKVKKLKNEIHHRGA